MARAALRETKLADDIEAQIIADEKSKRREKAEALARDSIDREELKRRRQQFIAETHGDAEQLLNEALAILPKAKPLADAVRQLVTDFETKMTAGNRKLEALGFTDANALAEVGLFQDYVLSCIRGQAFGMALVSDNKVKGWLRVARAIAERD